MLLVGPYDEYELRSLSHVTSTCVVFKYLTPLVALLEMEPTLGVANVMVSDCVVLSRVRSCAGWSLFMSDVENTYSFPILGTHDSSITAGHTCLCSIYVEGVVTGQKTH